MVYQQKNKQLTQRHGIQVVLLPLLQLTGKGRVGGDIAIWPRISMETINKLFINPLYAQVEEKENHKSHTRHKNVYFPSNRDSILTPYLSPLFTHLRSQTLQCILVIRCHIRHNQLRSKSIEARINILSHNSSTKENHKSHTSPTMEHQISFNQNSPIPIKDSSKNEIFKTITPYPNNRIPINNNIMKSTQ